MTNHNQWLFRQQLSVVSLTKILLDPFVAVLVLIGCTIYFHEPFKGPYLMTTALMIKKTLEMQRFWMVGATTKDG